MVGLFGADALIVLAAMTDFAFLSLLLWLAITPMMERRSTRHASFVIWLVLLVATETAIRIAWIVGQFDLSARLLQTALLIFVLLFAFLPFLLRPSLDQETTRGNKSGYDDTPTKLGGCI